MGLLWDDEANMITVYALQLLLVDWYTRSRTLYKPIKKRNRLIADIRP